MFNQFKVKLRSQVTKQVVAFDVTPELTETRNVTYRSLEPVHMPGTIYVYGHTSSREFNLNNIRLVSRTREEASKNLYRLNILRSWAMPYFGKNNPSSLIGAPPDVLSLSAYSTGPQDTANNSVQVREEQRAGEPAGPQNSDEIKRERATNIHNVPVVLQQISIPYPSDVDYIDTAAFLANDKTLIDPGVPFPTIMTIDIRLLETRSPRELNTFDLKAYRQGLLDTF